MAIESVSGLDINNIRVDGGTQPRAELSYETINDYAQQMQESAHFPPVIVFYDGNGYWLADGFHRYHACKRIGRESIDVEVRQGTRRDAVLFSVGANAAHGLRRTNADKRRAVETLLRDEEWNKWSNREIARKCSVSDIFVGKIRENLPANVCRQEGPLSRERTYITGNGTIAAMNTSNIGHSPWILPNNRQQLPTQGATNSNSQQIPAPRHELEQIEIHEREQQVQEWRYGRREEMPLLPFQEAAREELTQEHNEEDEEDNELTEEDRYQLAVDTGTVDYYHDGLRREAIARDERERSEAIDRVLEQREIRREQARERIEQLKAKGVELPTGKYGCLVIDPPWPMQKIERDVRPNQVEFDYPTMTEEELKAFPVPSFAGDDCHLYLWTTQKYLPMALRLAEHWGFRYQCLMTWVKNVGFTPFSWMYSTEHVLFCTKGNLPLLRKGLRLDFQAKVREHSRKPDEFYELVRQASPEPRIDVFSREKREGFDQYGNEVEKYAIQA